MLINDNDKIGDAKSKRGDTGEKEPIEVAAKSSVKSACARVDDVGWISFISFTWMFGWMWRAYKGRLSTDATQADLWKCSIFDSANVNMTRLEHLWNEEIKLAAAAVPARRPSLFRTVFRFIHFRMTMTCLVFMFCIVFGFIGPTCLVRGLLSFTEDPIREHGTPLYLYGFYMAISILLVEVLRVLAYGATWAISYRTALRVRGALLALLYKRLMHAKSLRGKAPAEIVNIFANDGQRIFDAVTFAPLVLVGPLVLIGGIIILLSVIGPLSLLGVAVFLLFDFIQAVLGIAMVLCRNKAIVQTEKRMAQVGELIQCIKCIKLNGWEELFYKRTRGVREREIKYLRIAGYAQSLAVASGSIVPVVATIVMVVAIVLFGHDLRASDAFSAITVFFVMMFGIRMIPYGIRYLAEARQALAKIESFLLFEAYDADFEAPAVHAQAIQLQHCTFAWDCATETKESGKTKGKKVKTSKSEGTAKFEAIRNGKLPDTNNLSKVDEERVALNEQQGSREQLEEAESDKTATSHSSSTNRKDCLRDVTLGVEKGELIGVCGIVGSGKSALLNAITGHLIGRDGRLCVSGSVALCSQHPSILSSTIRDNILFGQSMNSQRYYRTISAAQLAKDLEQFPENERSKISACKLSGGQRARISIARALYSNRDIYLFDDIFSSIDKPVASKIFSSGIKEMLAGKTRLLVTSESEYLAGCDRVVFMQHGRVVATGNHTELLSSQKAYQTFFSKAQNVSKVRSTSNVSEKSSPISISSAEGCVQNGTAVEKKIKDETVEVRDGDEEDYGLKPVGKKVYMEYIHAGGGSFLCALVLLSFVLNVCANIFGTAWLSKWMRDAHRNNTTTANGSQDGEGGMANSPPFYINVYAATVLVLFISGLIKALFFVKFTLIASTRLHNRMLRSVLHAKAAFFHQTPAGQILNRFSKDMDEIDVKLPFSVEMLLQGMITCIGFLLVIIWVFPAFLLAAVPLLGLFLLFFLCFRAGIRSLKRVENVTRSPVYEHLSSSLDAVPTIHAFGQTQRFVDQLKGRLDENSGALFLYHSAMRWQAVWLDLLVVCVTFAVSLMIVLLTDHIHPADAGMAIAFAMQLSGIFQFAVRSQTELEAKLTSVERVSYYYNNIEPEPEQHDPPELGPEWPRSGQLEFDHVVLRYSPQFPPALNSVTFSVEHAEKIGIIGRTGSGKTSLSNALFRLYPMESGQILLDGRDIGGINLRRLRRSMAIISQEPTLFADTLRFNVDPEGTADDARILEHFTRVGLDKSLSLDFMLEPGSQNLSAGQQQLVCMVRALLRHTKIVVMDEATANVDVQTDEQIQRAVREQFADRTVLVITHRLTNVASGLSRFLEMEDGRLKTTPSAKSSVEETPLYPDLPKIVIDDAVDNDAENAVVNNDKSKQYTEQK